MTYLRVAAVTAVGSRGIRSVRAAVASWQQWGPRRHLTAVVAFPVTILVVAIPTALVPNPVFGREVPPTAWAWPVLILTALLSGLLVATYVRDVPLHAPAAALGDGAVQASGGTAPADPAEPTRTGLVGGLLTFLAVGCPVCNKLALIALGYSGALRWFAPVQPWLAAGGVALLGWALVRRLENAGACPLPSESAPSRATIVG